MPPQQFGQSKDYQTHNSVVDRILSRGSQVLDKGSFNRSQIQSSHGIKGQVYGYQTEMVSASSKHSMRQLPPLNNGEQSMRSQQNFRQPSLLDQHAEKSELSKATQKIQHKYNVYSESEHEVMLKSHSKFEDDKVDEDQIISLERKIELMRDQLDTAKYKYEKKQLYELESKEREMLNKIDDLEKEIHQDHDWYSQMKDKLIQFKLQNQQIERQEREFEQYIWNVEREAEIEKMVRKKLEIEKMKQQQDLMNELLRKKELELVEIDQEKEKKDYSSAGLLKKALQRADIMQKQIEEGAIDLETQALLVDATLDKNPENQKIREQILEEIKAKMARDKEDQQFRNEELMQQLNIQRMKFLDAEKVIHEKKQLHSEIMRRGLDFLTEVELGNAPPLEYVVKNIYQNRQQDSDFQIEPVRAMDTVEKVKKNLTQEEERLRALMDDYQQTMQVLQQEAYRNQQAQDYSIVHIPQHKRDLVMPLVNEIFERSWQQIYNNEQTMIENKKDINRLRQQQEVRGARISQLAEVISQKELNERLIDEVVRDMIRKIATESSKLNDLALKKTQEIIARALKTQKGFPNSEQDLRKIFITLQNKHMEERKRDIHKIHHTIFALGNKPIPKVNLYYKIKAIQLQEIKQEENKNKSGENQEEEKAKDQNYVDEDAETIDPNESVNFVNNDEVKALEMRFFEMFKIEKQQIFGGTSGQKSGGVITMAISQNGRLVALGLTNGVLLVYDTLMNFQLVRIYAGSSTKYSQIEFSSDSMSQLTVLAQDGTFKSFLLRGKITLSDIESSPYFDPKMPPEEKPLELLPYYDLTHQHFVTAESKNPKKSQDLYQIQAASLHPQMSITGFQHSVVLAAKNGTILRYVSNVSSIDFLSKEEKLYGTLAYDTKSNTDFPFPQNFKLPDRPKGINKDYLEETKRQFQVKPVSEDKMVNREFFKGHRLPIIYLLMIENGPNILSIDSNAHIFVFKHEKETLSRKQTYDPVVKQRLLMEYMKFQRVSEQRVFPEGNSKDLDPNKLAQDALAKIQQYMQANINVDFLEQRCIDRLDNPKNGCSTFILPSDLQADDEQTRIFEEFTLNSQRLLVKRAQVKYKFSSGVAKLGQIKNTKNKKFVVIQLIKDHVFGQKDQQTHEFVTYRTDDFKLNRAKIVLNVDAKTPCAFDVSDEVHAIEFPYLYVLVGYQIKILSFLTNIVVKVIDLSQILKEVTQKQVKFDSLNTQHHREIYLTSNSFDSGYYLKLIDMNPVDTHKQYTQLYSKFNELYK